MAIQNKIAGALVAAAMALGQSAGAAGSSAESVKPCTGADTQLDGARRADYASRIVAAMQGAAQPADIEIERFIALDGWSLVFASTPISDPGWFVFDLTGAQPRYKDVWGGMADEGDRPELLK